MPISINDATNDVRRNANGARLYECDCCGTVAPWNDDWAWFGSLRQSEDFGLEGVPLVKTICSANCRVTMIADGRLPHEGIDDAGNVIEEKKVSAPFRKRRRVTHSNGERG